MALLPINKTYTKELCPRCRVTMVIMEDNYSKIANCTHCGFKQHDDKITYHGIATPPAWMFPASFALGLNNPPAPKDLPEEHVVCVDGGITGYRKWNASIFGNYIQSIRGTIWEPYARLEAKCENNICSGATCDCGIYSWKEAFNLYPPTGVLCDDFDKLKHIKGSVWLWGRVLQCELGYRAQFAYPKWFYDTGNLAKQMAAVYGVKLVPEPERPKVEAAKEEAIQTATGLAMQQLQSYYQQKYYPGQLIPYNYKP